MGNACYKRFKVLGQSGEGGGGRGALMPNTRIWLWAPTECPNCMTHVFLVSGTCYILFPLSEMYIVHAFTFYSNFNMYTYFPFDTTWIHKCPQIKPEPKMWQNQQIWIILPLDLAYHKNISSNPMDLWSLCALQSFHDFILDIVCTLCLTLQQRSESQLLWTYFWEV